MSRTEEFEFRGKEDTSIYYYRWNIAEEVKEKGVVLILHGMAEHALRYKEFANFLNQNGFIVYAEDHRGHGKTGATKGKLGYLGDAGWDLLVDDVYLLLNIIKSNHEGLPVILFGHSMGSILAKTCISEYGSEFDAVILSGTTNGVGLLTRKLGLYLSKSVSLLNGGKKQSPFLHSVCFGNYNKEFGLDTPFEWLSRDKKVIKDYIEDELCGFICTSGFYADMLDGINRNAKVKNVKKVPSSLPMLIISGKMDPVGSYSKDIIEVYRLYKDVAKLDNVKYKLFEDARHELLNEINKEEVYNDVQNWLKYIFN